jgi:hypothetical protein
MPCLPAPVEVPELDFAAVRPGFVAACMVEAAGARDGRRASVPVGGGDPSTPAASSAETRSLAPGGWPRGVSLSGAHALRYRMRRNRQMEHFTQVAEPFEGVFGAVRAITTRERRAARDLVLATLGNMTSV